MRHVLIGIVAGAVVAFGCIYLVQLATAALWPLPAGVDPEVAGGAETMVDRMAVGAKLAIAMGWTLGALLGGGIAAYIAHRRVAAWIVAALVISGALATISFVRHPTWLVAAGLLLPCAAAFVAQRLARRPPRLPG